MVRDMITAWRKKVYSSAVTTMKMSRMSRKCLQGTVGTNVTAWYEIHKKVHMSH